jgi:AcrR family transcriptional regulator
VKRADVATTTLYRRWSSKEQLLIDAFAWLRAAEEAPMGACDHMSTDQLAWVMTEMTPDALGRSDLDKLVARLIGSVRSNPKLMEAYWKTHLLPRRKAFS